MRSSSFQHFTFSLMKCTNWILYNDRLSLKSNRTRYFDASKMTSLWWNSLFNLVLNSLKLKELATNREICVSRTWFDDKSSTSRRISWHLCSCCFRSIFFSTNLTFFCVRNDQHTNHHNFASKVLFWADLKKYIIYSFNAINRSRYFI
jgi:hypothetical protein